jgi:replicative DNA helicase
VNRAKGLVPPHSPEAERAVLCAALLDPDAADEVGDLLGPDDWYSEQHREAWEAILALRLRGEAVDTVTLHAELVARGKLQQAGGLDALLEISRDLPPPNPEAHARIVRDKAMLRRLITECHRIAGAGYGEVPDVRSFLDVAEGRVFSAVAERHRGMGPAAARDIVTDRFEAISAMARAGQRTPGLQTGFPELDRMLAGLKPKELVILAGRPAMGKSALAGSICRHVSGVNGKVSLVFSLEMGREAWIDRVLSSESDIDGNALRTGQLTGDGWSKLATAASDIGKWPLFVDDEASVTLMTVRSRARRLKRRHGLDLIVVDYLQLMRSGLKTDSRELEISEISRGLRAIAKELEIPVLALAQLNRGLELRKDKRPMVSDLRESGAIEQDADVVMFVYRDEVYNPDSPDSRGVAEIIVGKQRSGPTGTVRVRFQKNRTRFVPLEHRFESGDYHPDAFRDEAAE